MSTLLSGNDEEVLATLGRQSDLDDSDHPYLDHVRRDSFYGFLASQREELFCDEDFAELCCSDNGRPSVPPSLLAKALVLQAYEGVSDEEAKARADFDLRWTKSTLQLFRARLILHERMQTVFRESLDFAHYTGYLQSRKLKVVLDTTYVLGRGVVKDTYNLLADGIKKLSAALAEGADCGKKPEVWADEHDLSRYFGSSVKGAAAIDWDDPEARKEFLASVVADADGLLKTARAALALIASDDAEHEHLHEAALLLERLLLQDIERGEDGTRLKQGVSPDRIVSVHDPEMRHSRKSASRRFDGHKAHLAVDPESQLILAAEVMVGNAPDRERALLFGGEILDVDANSNYGLALESFYQRHMSAVNHRTTVLVLGDGRGNGNPANAWALEEIGRRARQLIWFTPEKRPHWPLGGGDMPTYADLCDRVEVVRSLDQFDEVVDDMVTGALVPAK